MTSTGPPYTRSGAIEALTRHVIDGLYLVLAEAEPTVTTLKDGLGLLNTGKRSGGVGPALHVVIQDNGSRLYATDLQQETVTVLCSLDVTTLETDVAVPLADRVMDLTRSYFAAASCVGGWRYEEFLDLGRQESHNGTSTIHTWQLSGWVITRAIPPEWLTWSGDGLPLTWSDTGEIIYADR